MNNISRLKQLDREHKIITRMYLEKPLTASQITLLVAMINLMWTDTISVQFILITWGISYFTFLALDGYVLSHKGNLNFKKDPFFYSGFAWSNGITSMAMTIILLELTPHEPSKGLPFTLFLVHFTTTALTQMYFTSKYFLAVHLKRIETLEKEGVLMHASATRLARAAVDTYTKYTHG